MKRGKKTTVSKESIKKMMDKETKLKFDKELVYVKPFKVILQSYASQKYMKRLFEIHQSKATRRVRQFYIFLRSV